MPCEVPQDVYSGVAQQVSTSELFLVCIIFNSAELQRLCATKLQLMAISMFVFLVFRLPVIFYSG